MADEIQQTQPKVKKPRVAKPKAEVKPAVVETPVAPVQTPEVKSTAPATEVKTETKIEKKEIKPEVKKVKKTSAIVNARDLHISTKHCMSICDMIRGKDIDSAIKMLEEVSVFRRAVPMNNRQVGHRHGKGMMAGRYPINSSLEMIRLLKQLKANALHDELEIEKFVLFCFSNRGSRPYKSGGRRAKRSHVTLKLILNTKIAKKKETKGAKK